ncbi:MAG TPA: prepilin-type N-terminal cleavage/methylation domain-containing protein [Labilithrix sp.]|nr:prepilin-type N-terminal cleavage/methylation domain-containing protein [Labilithrix sp.]
MTPSVAKRARRRGYTIVEVMSAMTLFAIGAAGVIGMQRVTIQGGADARNFDIATNIAREWQARLQRDALQWTEPNSVVATSNRNTRTLWLKDDIDGAWHVPAPGPEIHGYSSAFDLLGHDVGVASDDRVFCVHTRLTWLTQAGSSAAIPVMRADIRVYWSRLNYGTPDCEDLSVETGDNALKHHFVHVSTAIRGNPTQ